MASPLTGAFATGWDPAPSVLVPAALGLVLYARGFLRLRGRGRGDLASPLRATAFGSGVVVALIALVTPLAGDAHTSLRSHMIEHVLIGDIAPALIAIGLTGPVFLFVVPRPILATVATTPWLRQSASLLTQPVVAVALWAAALGAWHIPMLYDAAVTSSALHALEHASFFLAGLLVWTAMLDSAPRRRLSLGRRLAVAGCLFAGGQVLADVLLFASPLYPTYAAAQHGSAINNQQSAAIVMMGEQTLTLGLFGALVLLRAFRGASARQSGGAIGNPDVESTLPSAMMVIAS